MGICSQHFAPDIPDRIGQQVAGQLPDGYWKALQIISKENENNS
jgi:hypothetical protein